MNKNKEYEEEEEEEGTIITKKAFVLNKVLDAI